MDTEFDDTTESDLDDEPKLYTDWNIQNEGRSWGEGEAGERMGRAPALRKIEMIHGKLFWSEEDRLNMLGLLLEQVGADRAVQFGDPEVWRKALAKLWSREVGFR
jgi:hypothetical protein